jgi:hypothetical protein
VFSAVILFRFRSEHEKSCGSCIGFGYSHGYIIHELKLDGVGLKQPFVIVELKAPISAIYLSPAFITTQARAAGQVPEIDFAPQQGSGKVAAASVVKLKRNEQNSFGAVSHHSIREELFQSDLQHVHPLHENMVSLEVDMNITLQ